jgi:hypothetical protein
LAPKVQGSSPWSSAKFFYLEKEMLDLTIGILSWRAHRTLVNTLESYKIFGLDLLAKEKIIYFQEQSVTDLSIASKYGYEAIGTKENLGIAAGYQALVERSTRPVFLFLENDWVLIDNPDRQLSRGWSFVESGIMDLIRYRHRKFPGNPLWTLQFQGREYDRPTHLLDSIHWTDPSKFREITQSPDLFITTSMNANWTNNPHMARTEWLLENIVPRIAGDIEGTLQEWWEQQLYMVGQGDGLFTHKRID